MPIKITLDEVLQTLKNKHFELLNINEFKNTNTMGHFKCNIHNIEWSCGIRYTLKNIDGTPLYTESKINEMRHSHRYKRLFASDLLKIDKDTDYNNINYDNDRANQLNQIHKLVIEKPITKKINRTPKDKTINEEPQEIRRSTRIRKENKNKDYVY